MNKYGFYLTQVPDELRPDHTKGLLYYTIPRNKEIDEKRRIEYGMTYKEWNDHRIRMISYLVDYHYKDFDRLCAFTNEWLGRMYSRA